MLAAALNCYFPAVGGQADLHTNKQESLGRGLQEQMWWTVLRLKMVAELKEILI